MTASTLKVLSIFLGGLYISFEDARVMVFWNWRGTATNTLRIREVNLAVNTKDDVVGIVCRVATTEFLKLEATNIVFIQI